MRGQVLAKPETRDADVSNLERTFLRYLLIVKNPEPTSDV